MYTLTACIITTWSSRLNISSCTNTVFVLHVYVHTLCIVYNHVGECAWFTPRLVCMCTFICVCDLVYVSRRRNQNRIRIWRQRLKPCFLFSTTVFWLCFALLFPNPSVNLLYPRINKIEKIGFAFPCNMKRQPWL